LRNQKQNRKKRQILKPSCIVFFGCARKDLITNKISNWTNVTNVFGEDLEYSGAGTMFRECFRKKIRGIRGIRLIRDKAKKIRVLLKTSILDKHQKHCSLSY